MSKAGLFLLVVLALIAALEACGRSCLHRRIDGRCMYHSGHTSRKYRRYGRQVLDDDQYSRDYYGYSSFPEEFSTSCGRSICTNVQGYPSERINDAVNLVRRIMTSSNRDMEERRKEIDPEVLNFHSRPLNKVTNGDLEVNVDGCSIRANIVRPQEGVSVEDDRLYFIVNIPSLQQRVQYIECLGGKSEECNVEGDSTCQQAYREESLLTLPANVRRHYEARDFKIKRFRVPNGCKCGEGADLVVSLD